MRRFLTRLYEWYVAPEEINGHELCLTYMYRWTVLRLLIAKVYLHHFVGDDWARDRHDHPKRFISIGLKGCYIEETPSGERFFQAPWIRTFSASHIHRLRMYDHRDCWTLVIVFWNQRHWGFWRDSVWVPWKLYVNSKLARPNC